jgi:uncharacterized protein (DUF924 family)
MDRIEDVLTFWLETCSPKDWYASTPELDAEITAQFEGLWEQARAGSLEHWALTARGALAYLILTDQFPRNMFRGTQKAFATDASARAVAKKAIARGLDMQIEAPTRQFFYLPLEHSECLSDQNRAVRLIVSRLESAQTLLHARAHREVIRQFGRFPFRNDALSRTSTKQEQAFMAAGGYGAFLKSLSSEAA